MKFLAILTGIFLAVTVNLPAYAQPGGRDHPRRFERPQQQGPQENQQRQRPRQEEQESDRGGQLTPEERQQLRRDIREHGQEVYRERPRRF